MSSLEAENTILVLTHNNSISAVQDFIKVLVDPGIESPPPPETSHSHSDKEQVEQNASPRIVEWNIDNKYYTARVCFFIHPYVDTLSDSDSDTAATEGTLVLKEKLENIPAVIYAYTSSDHFPPPQTLVDSISDASPELCFGIRIPHAVAFAGKRPISGEQTYDPVTEEEEMDSLGMEYIDFTSLYNPTVKDHRQTDVTTATTAPSTGTRTTATGEALKQLCDSLQTIMWPSMLRKKVPTTKRPRQQAVAHSATPTSGSGSDKNGGGSGRMVSMPKTTPNVPPPAASTSMLPSTSSPSHEDGFPVRFPSTFTAASLDHALPPPHAQTRDRATTPLNPFALSPGAEEAFLAQEQEELDTWLNTDDDMDAGKSGEPTFGVVHLGKEKAGIERIKNDNGQGFDDDFGSWDIGTLMGGRAFARHGEERGHAVNEEDDEFSAFQSAPRETKSLASSPNTTNDCDIASSPCQHASSTSHDAHHDDDDDDSGIPIDPTALLNHLQSLRTELSNVQDEDERRARAGKEVVDVLRGLGIRLEDLDLDLEGEGI